MTGGSPGILASEPELKCDVRAADEQAKFGITVFEIIMEPAIPEINVEPLGDVEFECGIDVPREVAADAETTNVATQLVGEPIREP